MDFRFERRKDDKDKPKLEEDFYDGLLKLEQSINALTLQIHERAPLSEVQTYKDRKMDDLENELKMIEDEQHYVIEQLHLMSLEVHEQGSPAKFNSYIDHLIRLARQRIAIGMVYGQYVNAEDEAGQLLKIVDEMAKERLFLDTVASRQINQNPQLN